MWSMVLQCKGGTPLALATEDENGAILKLLLEKGANLESKIQVVKYLCGPCGKGEDVALLLLKKGAGIECKDKNGQNAVVLGCREGLRKGG